MALLFPASYTDASIVWFSTVELSLMLVMMYFQLLVPLGSRANLRASRFLTSVISQCELLFQPCPVQQWCIYGSRTSWVFFSVDVWPLSFTGGKNGGKWRAVRCPAILHQPEDETHQGGALQVGLRPLTTVTTISKPNSSFTLGISWRINAPWRLSMSHRVT